MEILGDKAKIGSACLVYTYSRSAHIQAYSWKDLLVLPMIDLSGPATPTNTPFSRRQGHNDGGGDGNEYTCDLDISIHSGSSLCLPFTWYTFYLFRKIYVNSIYIWYLIKHEMFFNPVRIHRVISFAFFLLLRLFCQGVYRIKDKSRIVIFRTILQMKFAID